MSGRWFKHYVPVLWMTGTFAVGILLGAISWQTVPDKDFYDRYTLVETTQGCHFSREMKISKAVAALQAISQ